MAEMEEEGTGKSLRKDEAEGAPPAKHAATGEDRTPLATQESPGTAVTPEYVENLRNELDAAERELSKKETALEKADRELDGVTSALKKFGNALPEAIDTLNKISSVLGDDKDAVLASLDDIRNKLGASQQDIDKRLDAYDYVARQIGSDGTKESIEARLGHLLRSAALVNDIQKKTGKNSTEDVMSLLDKQQARQAADSMVVLNKYKRDHKNWKKAEAALRSDVEAAREELQIPANKSIEEYVAMQQSEWDSKRDQLGEELGAIKQEIATAKEAFNRIDELEDAYNKGVEERDKLNEELASYGESIQEAQNYVNEGAAIAEENERLLGLIAAEEAALSDLRVQGKEVKKLETFRATLGEKLERLKRERVSAEEMADLGQLEADVEHLRDQLEPFRGHYTRDKYQKQAKMLKAQAADLEAELLKYPNETSTEAREYRAAIDRVSLAQKRLNALKGTLTTERLVAKTERTTEKADKLETELAAYEGAAKIASDLLTAEGRIKAATEKIDKIKTDHPGINPGTIDRKLEMAKKHQRTVEDSLAEYERAAPLQAELDDLNKKIEELEGKRGKTKALPDEDTLQAALKKANTRLAELKASEEERERLAPLAEKVKLAKEKVDEMESRTRLAAIERTAAVDEDKGESALRALEQKKREIVAQAAAADARFETEARVRTEAGNVNEARGALRAGVAEDKNFMLTMAAKIDDVIADSKKFDFGRAYQSIGGGGGGSGSRTAAKRSETKRAKMTAPATAKNKKKKKPKKKNGSSDESDSDDEKKKRRKR